MAEISTPAPPPAQEVAVVPPADAPSPTPASRSRARQVASSAWSTRGLWLGGLAFLVSLWGTLLLVSPDTRTWGELLLLVAAVGGMIAWGGQRWIAGFAPRMKTPPLVRRQWERWVRLAGVGAAAVMVWLANAANNAHPDEVFGQAGWLWLASMALLMVTAWGWPLPADGDNRAPGPPGRQRVAWLWRRLTGRRAPAQPEAVQGVPVDPAREPNEAMSPGVEAREAGRAEREEPPAWTWWEVGVFVAIVVLAVVLRVWDLRDYPYAIHSDEILTARTAIDSWDHGNSVPLFSTVWYAIDLPALWFVFVDWSLRAGNFTLEAVRLPAALFGAATVLPLYGLLRGTWGRWAAIAGSAMLAFNISNLQFSRVSINNIVSQFFWAACFFFLLRGLRLKRPVDWVLAGIFGGLGEHFFYGTRLLWMLLIIFGVYLLVVHWRRGWEYLGHFALLALGYLAAFGPLLAYFLRNPELYFGRGQRALTWNHIPTSWDDLANMWNTLWPIMSQNLLTISSKGGGDAFYFASLMLPAEAALLALGVVLLLWRWRHPASALVLIWGGGVLVAGGTLIVGSGNINHWTPGLPAFFVAAAVPVGSWAASGAFSLGARLRPLVPAAAGVGLVVLAWLNIDFYFGKYYAVRPEFELRAMQSRYQAALGTGYRVRVVGRTWQPYDAETNSYLIKGQDGAQIWNPASELPLVGEPGKGLGFFFFPDDEQYLTVVQALYPGGRFEELKSHGPTPVHMFDAYVVSPEEAASAYGLRLEIFDSSGRSLWSGQVRTVGDLPLKEGYPLRARWSGMIYMPTIDNAAHTYRLELSGLQGTTTFDGQPSLPGKESIVQPGWHSLVVEATFAGPASPKLMWGRDSDNATEVQAGNLWPSLPGQGLLGAVAVEGKAPAIRTDPFIGFTDLGTPGQFGPGVGASQPVHVRWAGQLNVPKDFDYTLEVRTDGAARLTVDGVSLPPYCAAGDPVEVKSFTQNMHLTKGWHDLQIDYIASPRPSTLELYWTPPGGQRHLIPPDAFRFAEPSKFRGVTPPSPPDMIDCAAP